MLWNTKQNIIELLTQCRLFKKPLQNSLTSSAEQTAWRSHEYLRAKAVYMSLDFLATTPQLRAVEIWLEGKSKAHG